MGDTCERRPVQKFLGARKKKERKSEEEEGSPTKKRVDFLQGKESSLLSEMRLTRKGTKSDKKKRSYYATHSQPRRSKGRRRTLRAGGVIGGVVLPEKHAPQNTPYLHGKESTSRKKSDLGPDGGVTSSDQVRKGKSV